MKDYILEGQCLQVPTSWKDVTFETYIKAKSGNYKTDLQLISLFTGLNQEVVKNLRIGQGYQSMINDLSFIGKDIDPDYIPPNSATYEGKEYKLPLDIGTETIGQYNDLKNLIDGEGWENYAKAVAIYLQPKIDGYYNYTRTQEIVKGVYNMPSDFVVCMGGFFLENAFASKNKFMKTYRRHLLPQTKFKRAIKSFQINMDFYLRYVIYPKIQGLLKMKSYNGQ